MKHKLIFILIAILFISPTLEAKENLKTSSEKHQNKLITEKSPYLLQHADNPVDWYPWGDEAFNKAKEENKPIFLSIGYSTCHWCHVMEHESFENAQMAQMLNELFVSIKVDREERPDIDNIYMSAVMAMTGSGGWPLSVFLTPDKKPFFGGTYFPPEARWGSPGFADILLSVSNAWKTKQEDVLKSSHSFVELMQKNLNKGKAEGELKEGVLKQSFLELQSTYDEQLGGFGSAPKFPTSHTLSFLLRYYKRYNDPQALVMVEHTLKQMANGGMYDQLGGGFHRYSTDAHWQVPHFEKMLYDQAILARTYLEAYQITKNEFYARIAHEIFDYVLRDMTDAHGGFYSAEDADSLNAKGEKKEGAFYVWNYDEIYQHLDEGTANIFCFYFGVEKNGNARSDPHGEFIDQNIIFVDKTIEEVAKHFKVSKEQVRDVLQKSKEKLFHIRTSQPRPHLDDKVLVDWNGLMISSLAFGARVLNESKYGEAAKKATDFIIKTMIKEKRLLHRYREGEVGILGTIEDYAFFIDGLFGLYEYTFDTSYLHTAKELTDQMITLFWDESSAGFFFTGDDSEELIVKQKEIYDGAIPSGNSFAALVLLRLYHLTLNQSYKEKAIGLFNNFAKDINMRPSAYSQMLMAFDFALGPVKEIVVAGKTYDQIESFVDQIYKTFLPQKVVIFRQENDDNLSAIAPFTKEQGMLEDKVTVYVCENHVCKLPIHTQEKLGELLK